MSDLVQFYKTHRHLFRKEMHLSPEMLESDLKLPSLEEVEGKLQFLKLCNSNSLEIRRKAVRILEDAYYYPYAEIWPNSHREIAIRCLEGIDLSNPFEEWVNGFRYICSDFRLLEKDFEGYPSLTSLFSYNSFKAIEEDMDYLCLKPDGSLQPWLLDRIEARISSTLTSLKISDRN